MHPLYEHDQVITEEELLAFQVALARQYNSIPWYRPVMRWATGVAIGVIIGLTTWLREGKNTVKGELK